MTFLTTNPGRISQLNQKSVSQEWTGSLKTYYTWQNISAFETNNAILNLYLSISQYLSKTVLFQTNEGFNKHLFNDLWRILLVFRVTTGNPHTPPAHFHVSLFSPRSYITTAGQDRVEGKKSMIYDLRSMFFQIIGRSTRFGLETSSWETGRSNECKKILDPVKSGVDVGIDY